MKNQTLNSEVTPISEETANEWTEIFKQMHKSTEEIARSFDNLSGLFTKYSIKFIANIITLSFNKTTLLELKYINANILTRWYWKRKYEKADKSHKNLMIYVNKYLETINESKNVQNNQ